MKIDVTFPDEVRLAARADGDGGPSGFEWRVVTNQTITPDDLDKSAAVETIEAEIGETEKSITWVLRWSLIALIAAAAGLVSDGLSIADLAFPDGLARALAGLPGGPDIDARSVLQAAVVLSLVSMAAGLTGLLRLRRTTVAKLRRRTISLLNLIREREDRRSLFLGSGQISIHVGRRGLRIESQLGHVGEYQWSRFAAGQLFNDAINPGLPTFQTPASWRDSVIPAILNDEGVPGPLQTSLVEAIGDWIYGARSDGALAHAAIRLPLKVDAGFCKPSQQEKDDKKRPRECGVEYLSLPARYFGGPNNFQRFVAAAVYAIVHADRDYRNELTTPPPEPEA